MEKTIDIDKILQSKMGDKARRVPRFLVRWLKHIVHEDEVNEFCLELPRYKRPRRIIFADVPRNPTGKIEKPKLRQMYCGESVVAQQIEQ